MSAASFRVGVHPGAAVFEASCKEEVLDHVRAKIFDVIFLDLCIPTSSYSDELSAEHGLSLLSLFKGSREEPQDDDLAKRITAPVIVMYGESERRFVDDVMRRSASSFVPKSASHEVMLEAIQRALHGGVYLPSATIGKGGIDPDPVIDLRPADVAAISHKDLGITQREFVVLRLALQGNAPWKIAAILEINPVNVRQYSSKLYGKFGVVDLSIACKG